jgi:hypothetical protein
MSDVLDLTPLRKSLAQLESALQQTAENPGNTLLRDGAIQRFE